MVNDYRKFFNGTKQVVKCYSEFQPLEEVIVGSTYNPSCFDSSDTNVFVQFNLEGD